MSKIKHRTMVHIALNAKGERVSYLAAACGKLIALRASQYLTINDLRTTETVIWLSDFPVYASSVREWKQFIKVKYKAVRFQRVMLVGGVRSCQ